ncbi:alpha/beta-hydrolase [Testicularia cyperi]|uniref:Carboxypeptidase n=1 Tax=Testicularia cyperi TaxID=1882483 RepID=A0A317XJJ1_9BASI|nr:alpha/beta-hydrolase [Testicularia cyperi]
MVKIVPTALLLAGALVYETCARSLQHVGKFNMKSADVHQRLAARGEVMAKRQAASTSMEPRHLTDKSKPFFVNGSALPDIDFDIGESYAGLLPISDDPDETRKLYFWYFPSRNEAAEQELTIWTNGGPGCSSLEGLMQENGPWLWQYGTYKPVANPWSWTNLTNMLWVEQPVGTGFSQGTPNITSQAELAEQFKGFYRNFADTFNTTNRQIYITGESYAGQYVPWIASSMLDEEDKEYFNVSGIMIYDPSISTDQLLEQTPVAQFTRYWDGLFPFNSTVRAKIDEMDAKCGYTKFLDEYMVFPPKGKMPPPPAYSDECDLFDYVFTAILDINPCFDIYQVATTCPLLWDVLGFPGSMDYVPYGADIYFNRTDVKEAINAPVNTSWTTCSVGNVFNTKSGLDSEAEAGKFSSETVLPGVIDRVERTIIAHGMLDMVLLANGTLLALQNMTWGGMQGFQNEPTEPFYVPFHNDYQLSTLAASGTMGKTITERGLSWISNDLSGHMLPQYQPSSAYRQLEFLLGRIDSLSSKQPFTTSDAGYQAQNTIPEKRAAAELNAPFLAYNHIAQRDIAQIINEF